mgnify:FL=1
MNRAPKFAKRLLIAAIVAASGLSLADTDGFTATNSELDGRLFYQILSGEIANRQGDNGLAFRFISAAAKSSDDESLSARAVEIAIQAGSGDAAWGAVNDWIKRQPDSQKAQAMKLRVSIATGRMNGITDALSRILAQSTAEERRELIRAIPGTLNRLPNVLQKKADDIAQASLKSVKQDRLFAAAAWAAIGFVRVNNQDMQGALRALGEAYRWDAADLDAGRLALTLLEQGVAEAEPLVLKHIAALPIKTNARFSYARLLFIDNRQTPALEQIERIHKDEPTFIPAWLLQGQIALQKGDLQLAETAATKALTLNQSAATAGTAGSQAEQARSDLIERQSRLLLADVAQARGDWTGVEQRLSLIPADDDVNYRRAVALGKQGRTEEALRLLEPAEATAQDEAADSRKNAMNMKVRWLREFDRTADAYELSAEMMSAFPDDIDVMYGHAMLAEQLKRHDEMERLLRAVIAKKPDYAHAYNALGYAWVDRGVRLAEAQALIEEALKRSPNDPLITDSLGWAYYRQGQLTLAARTLQKAYSLKQDPEIAAHLGEVWWQLGQTESAEKLLRDAVARYPSNSVLKDTIKRLGLAL